MKSPLPFHFVSLFLFPPESSPLSFLSSMHPCFSPLLLSSFFLLCLSPSPSLHLALSLALRFPLARSCKWLPANGLSEEKTDLNEEWRQKREQRGSKRRCTQRDVCLLETHSLYVCVFSYVCICVFKGLYCTVGSSPRLEGNPLPRLYHWECQE